MEYNASALNEMFLQKLNTPDGIEKAAQEGAAFIRQKLREVSFARKIIQPQYVMRPELQRSINHEGLVKIVDIEPDIAILPTLVYNQRSIKTDRCLCLS